jgi:hypothetical protein
MRVQSGAVKIGIAHNIEARLGEIQIGNHEQVTIVYEVPCRNADQARELETLLHQRYVAAHIRGEWFMLDVNQIMTDITFAKRFMVLFMSTD